MTVAAYIYQVAVLESINEGLGTSNPGLEKAGWKFLGEIDGVRTYQRFVPGTNMLAFRGEMDVDMPMSLLIGPFYDLRVTKKWVDMLDFITEHDLADDHPEVLALKSSWGGNKELSFGRNIMHQVCSLPPPLAKREFVMSRSVKFDTKRRRMDAFYESVEDDRFPHQDGIVRGETPHTLWTFQSIPNPHMQSSATSTFPSSELDENPPQKRHFWEKKQTPPSSSAQSPKWTRMSLESEVDTKLPIPGFILNFMQRYWPSKSLNAFKKICREEGHKYNLSSKQLPRDIREW